MNVKIAIASYGRPEQPARKCPFVEHAYFLVEKWEVDLYRAVFKQYGREPLGVLPLEDNWGAGDMRNKSLDVMWSLPGTEAVWLFDDDVEHVATTTYYRERPLPVADVIRAVHNTCESAAQAGTGVCGFTKLLSTEFRVFKPVTFIGVIDCQTIGHTDRELRYDPKVTLGDSTDLCLRAVMQWGFIWRDNRYRPWTGPNWVAGGSARWRTAEDIENSQAYINEKYRKHTGGRDVLVSVDMFRPGRGQDVQTGRTRRVRFDLIGAAGP